MYKQELKYYKKAFFTAMIMGVILLLPFVIIDGGYFIYYGDYNAQQIPFYTLCNKALKSGSFMWDWYTDLGVNFIGSYSFYTIGSPFFLLSLPFPAEFAKYLMAPLLVLKFSCCSVFAFAYIRRFVKKPMSALIGGLLYAFSGFSMYNVFFNHFHEAMVVFPLMLIALEETVVNKRRVFFALTVALNAYVNYFFFVGECIFLVIYFLCRLTDPKFRINLKTFGVLAFESVIGVALAGVMFVPAILTCLGVPRLNTLNGWNLVFHNPVQRYGLIFQSLFFPADIPARQNFFPDTSARWASVSAYLPLFSMAGVISFIRYKKKHWAKILMPIMLLCALVPALNSAFVLFNTNYYTRWFYMPVLIACFMTSYALENNEIDIRYGLKWCALGVGLISLVGILPSEVNKEVTLPDGDTSEIKVTELFSLPGNKLPFWLSVAFAVIAIVVCYILVKNKNKLRQSHFLHKAFCFTVVACIGFSYYTLIYGRAIGPKVGDYNSIVNAEIELPKEDGQFYRVETYGVTNNANMLWDMYGFRSFHSIVPGAAFEYYEGMGFNRSVNTDPDGTYYAMRSVNSCKYLVIQSYKLEYKDTKKLLENMRNFTKIDEQDGFTIFENQYFVPMGYSYDYYMTEKEYMVSGKSNRDNLLLKGCVLSDEQIIKYMNIMDPVPIDDSNALSYEDYQNDSKKLAESCVDTFTTVANGFVATSSFETDRFVVFTVPYESGWSATVNGEPVDIEKVNKGVMGIKVPAGQCEIKFDYVTPGLKAGAVLTVISVVILVAYYIVHKKVFKYKPNPNAHLYEEEQLSKLDNHNYYIRSITAKAERFKRNEINHPEAIEETDNQKNDKDTHSES